MNHAGCSQLNFSRAGRKESAGASGPPRVIIRTCKHILESGAFCQAAAVGGRAYCRAHLVVRVRHSKMARARRRAGILRLPELSDLQAVQSGLKQVRVALDAGHLDEGRARLMRWAMRMIATDLRFQQSWSPHPSDAVPVSNRQSREAFHRGNRGNRAGP